MLDSNEYSWVYYFFPTYTFQRPQHISINLAQNGDNLIWFRFPRSVLGYLTSKDFIGLLEALKPKQTLRVVEFQKGMGLKLFQPKGVFPLPQSLLPLKILIKIKKAFLKQLKFLPQPDFVLLAWSIFEEELQLIRKIFPRTKIIFDIMDDIPGFYEKKPSLKKSFFDTLKEVDGVISINKGLLEKYKKWINVPSIIIPNGVSFPEPPAFALKTKEIQTVGYFGAFDFWFDFDFLERLAISLPHLWFFLAGPFTKMTSKRMKKILQIQNIKYFGALPFEKVPDFLKEIDLLVIPWLPLELCRLADPIKIKEALYAGVPVIYPFSTGDPKIDSKIIITGDLEKIREICEKSLLPKPETRKQWAEEIAEEYSWKSLVTRLREFCINLAKNGV